MKRKIYRTKYGCIKYKQYGYEDVYPRKAMDQIPKDRIFQHINAYSVKSNLKKAKQKTSNYLYRLMWQVIVDKAMEGSIITMPYGGEVHIGKIDSRSKIFPNLHTKGNQYNIKMNLPMAHSYKLRMPKRRRDELKERLEGGQQFHNF